MQSPETKKSNYQAKSIANKIIRLIYVFLLLSIGESPIQSHEAMYLLTHPDLIFLVKLLHSKACFLCLMTMIGLALLPTVFGLAKAEKDIVVPGNYPIL
jgi:hypothetical protein